MIAHAGRAPMNHEAAFLEAVADDPDNDALRLIFADYLDERDDPRGEFIRVQIELAGMAEDDPRRKELRRRENALLATHENQWLGDSAQFLEEWDFERGLLDSIEIDASKFLAHADELFRLGPIRRLRLSDVTVVMTAL